MFCDRTYDPKTHNIITEKIADTVSRPYISDIIRAEKGNVITKKKR